MKRKMFKLVFLVVIVGGAVGYARYKFGVTGVTVTTTTTQPENSKTVSVQLPDVKIPEVKMPEVKVGN